MTWASGDQRRNMNYDDECYCLPFQQNTVYSWYLFEFRLLIFPFVPGSENVNRNFVIPDTWQVFCKVANFVPEGWYWSELCMWLRMSCLTVYLAFFRKWSNLVEYWRFRWYHLSNRLSRLKEYHISTLRKNRVAWKIHSIDSIIRRLQVFG